MRIFRYEGECAEDTDRIVFEMPYHTWIARGALYFSNPNDPTDAATKKCGHGKLHKGNLALVHPGSGLGSREGNGFDIRLWGGSEAAVNEYLRQTVEANLSIQIIIAENKKDMHDDPNLDLDAIVMKFI